jgi:hypothetical protein
MLGVLANDTHHSMAVNDFALVADLLYGCTDLHLVSFGYGRREAACFVQN